MFGALDRRRPRQEGAPPDRILSQSQQSPGNPSTIPYPRIGPTPPLAQPVSGQIGTPPLAHPVHNPSTGYGSTPYYPRVAVGPPVVQPPPVASSSFTSPGGATGINVRLKPEYQVAPAVQLSEQGEVRRTELRFDFDLERSIVAQAETGRWERPMVAASNHLHSNGTPVPPTTAGSSGNPSSGSSEDPIVRKYCDLGYPREAVTMAVTTYGDVQSKIVDFCSHFMRMREMGFGAADVSGALAMYDNDVQQAIAHLAGG